MPPQDCSLFLEVIETIQVTLIFFFSRITNGQKSTFFGLQVNSQVGLFFNSQKCTLFPNWSCMAFLSCIALRSALYLVLKLLINGFFQSPRFYQRLAKVRTALQKYAVF